MPKSHIYCLLILLLTFPTLSHASLLSLEYEPRNLDPAKPVSVEIEFITEKKGKVVRNKSGKMLMTFHGDQYAISFDTEDSDAASTVIFDSSKRTMTTITSDKTGKTSAVIMPLIQLRQKAIDDFVGEITKTSSSKDLLGYKTHKYIITSEDGTTTESWIANVSSFKWEDLLQALGYSNKMSRTSFAPVIKDTPNAFSLESHSTTKGGKMVTHMYVRSIKEGERADLEALKIPEGSEVQDLTSLLKF